MLFPKAQLISLHILLLFFLTTGKCNKLWISQTPSVIRALKGETVKINCSFSAGNATQLRIKWKRNSTGEEQYQYILNKNKTDDNTTKNRLSRVGGVFDVTKNSSSLIIRNLHLCDSDLYVCEAVLQIPPPVRHLTGNGTYLKVEARPIVKLREEALPLSDGTKQLVCESLEFFPPDIQISWFEDGQFIANGTDNGTLQSNSDGSFSVTSFLNLSVSVGNETKNYSCQVNHSTLSAPVIEWIPVNLHGVHLNDSSDPDNFAWLWIPIAGSVILMIGVVVVVMVVLFFKHSASKTKAPSPRDIPVTPKDQHDVREQVPESTNNEEFGIYTLLGQGLRLPV